MNIYQQPKSGVKNMDKEKTLKMESYKEEYPKIYSKWKSEELTTDRALRQIKGWHQIEKRKTTQISLQKEKLSIIKKYKVIYADPPWDYGINNRTGFGGDAGTHYTVMSLQDICDLPVNEISEKNSVLFMWVTSPFAQKAFKVVEAWGFKYKSMFIWDKVDHNMGWYNSVRHELLYICTKGSCTPENKILFDSVQSVKRSSVHSSKPEKFKEIIEVLYPEATKIELFARESSEGWDVWGNQSGK